MRGGFKSPIRASRRSAPATHSKQPAFPVALEAVITRGLIQEYRMFDLTNRLVIQQIEQSARHMEDISINEYWKRAYADLAAAADRLDAMVARTEVATSNSEQ